MPTNSEIRIRLVARKLLTRNCNWEYELLANWLGVSSYFLPERRVIYLPLRDFITSVLDAKWLADQVIVKLNLSEQQCLHRFLLTREF